MKKKYEMKMEEHPPIGVQSVWGDGEARGVWDLPTNVGCLGHETKRFKMSVGVSRVGTRTWEIITKKKDPTLREISRWGGEGCAESS